MGCATAVLATVVLALVAILLLYEPGVQAGSLYDVPHYYVKADGVTYRVVILKDGSHVLVQEPIEGGR